MSKWNYLVVDEDGEIFGTNDDKLAVDVAENWDTSLIYDAVAGELMGPGGERTELRELTAPPSDNAPDEDEEGDDE